VATVTYGSREPGVAADSGGGFLVAWDEALSACYRRIAARRYDGAGVPTTDAFPVNLDTLGWHTEPAVASLGNDHFVVVWQAGDIFGQRFGPDVLFGSGFE